MTLATGLEKEVEAVRLAVADEVADAVVDEAVVDVAVARKAELDTSEAEANE